MGDLIAKSDLFPDNFWVGSIKQNQKTAVYK